jgi:5-oxoprolinase (ATP-hydrolysing)
VFLAPFTLSLMSARRTTHPYGLAGGGVGACGVNRVARSDGVAVDVPGRATLELAAGDRLCVETPGGGGYGSG